MILLSQWKGMILYVESTLIFLPEDDVYTKEKRICEEKRIRGFYGRW